MIQVHVTSLSWGFESPLEHYFKARNAPSLAGFFFNEERRIKNAVSIHAPARGATTRTGSNPLRDSFQFTRPRGARLKSPQMGRLGESFQFTRPRGARLGVKLGGEWVWKVSIHAPARGATKSKATSISAARFQFTRPRGARPTCRLPKPANVGSFNSRAREGRDAASALTMRVLRRFQFTRPRGARRDAEATALFEILFQFTRPRGARRLIFIIGLVAAGFQFTRPRGARLYGCLSFYFSALTMLFLRSV